MQAALITNYHTTLFGFEGAVSLTTLCEALLVLPRRARGVYGGNWFPPVRCILRGAKAFPKKCYASYGPLVKWSRRRPLTPQSGVRLSHGSPLNISPYFGSLHSSFGLNSYRRYAPLAQLVEHLTLNQGVHGSSP